MAPWKKAAFGDRLAWVVLYAYVLAGLGGEMGEREDNEIPKGPAWLSSPGWWVQIAAVAVGLVAIRYFMNGGQFV